MGLGEGLLGKVIVNRCHRVKDQCVTESKEKLRTEVLLCYRTRGEVGAVRKQRGW